MFNLPCCERGGKVCHPTDAAGGHRGSAPGAGHRSRAGTLSRAARRWDDQRVSSPTDGSGGRRGFAPGAGHRSRAAALSRDARRWTDQRAWLPTDAGGCLPGARLDKADHGLLGERVSSPTAGLGDHRGSASGAGHRSRAGALSGGAHRRTDQKAWLPTDAGGCLPGARLDKADHGLLGERAFSPTAGRGDHRGSAPGADHRSRAGALSRDARRWTDQRAWLPTDAGGCLAGAPLDKADGGQFGERASSPTAGLGDHRGSASGAGHRSRAAALSGGARPWTGQRAFSPKDGGGRRPGVRLDRAAHGRVDERAASPKSARAGPAERQPLGGRAKPPWRAPSGTAPATPLPERPRRRFRQPLRD